MHKARKLDTKAEKFTLPNRGTSILMSRRRRSPRHHLRPPFNVCTEKTANEHNSSLIFRQQVRSGMPTLRSKLVQIGVPDSRRPKGASERFTKRRLLCAALPSIRGQNYAVGCNAITAMPMSAIPAPSKSQRVRAMPSTKCSHNRATAIYMPP